MESQESTSNTPLVLDEMCIYWKEEDWQNYIGRDVILHERIYRHYDPQKGGYVTDASNTYIEGTIKSVFCTHSDDDANEYSLVVILQSVNIIYCFDVNNNNGLFIIDNFYIY